MMSVRRVWRPLFVWLFCLTALPVTAELREIDWLELMPAEDLALLENMPEIVHEGDGRPCCRMRS